MIVLMTHPKHGFTHAYSAEAVKQLEAQGWVVKKEPEPRPTLKLKKHGN